MAKLRIAPLKGHEAFPKVFKKSRKFTEKDAVLFVQFRTQDEIQSGEIAPVFLGVTIRKKTAKSAVMRNRVKRLLRVALRNVLKEITETHGQLPFQACIAVWQRVPERPMQLRLAHVEPVIRQLAKYAAEYHSAHFLKNPTE
jgi:ribonuclease P protein component